MNFKFLILLIFVLLVGQPLPREASARVPLPGESSKGSLSDEYTKLSHDQKVFLIREFLDEGKGAVDTNMIRELLEYFGNKAAETASDESGYTVTEGQGTRKGSSFGQTSYGGAIVNYGFEPGNPKSGDIYRIDGENGSITKVGDLDEDNDGNQDSSGTSSTDTGNDDKSDEEKDPVTNSEE